MKLAFKLDENMPAAAADLLRAAGCDVHTALDQNLGGKDDPTLAEVCRREDRALVTLDMDFADIRLYPPDQFAGLIVLRPGRQDIDQILFVMRNLIEKFESEPLRGRLWLATEVELRIRPG